MFLWAAPPEPGVGDRGLVFSSKSLTLRLHEEKSPLPWGRASDSMGPPSPLHSLLSELEKSLSNGSQESRSVVTSHQLGLSKDSDLFLRERKEEGRDTYKQGESEKERRKQVRNTEADRSRQMLAWEAGDLSVFGNSFYLDLYYFL